MPSSYLPRRALRGVFLTLGLAACAPSTAGPELSAPEAHQRAQAGQLTLVDIRRPDEWRQTGVVEGSRKLTFVDAHGRVNPNFLRSITAEVGMDDPVVLICRSGNRTDTLARQLVEHLGYTRVYNVEDGIRAWIADNLPVIRH